MYVPGPCMSDWWIERFFLFRVASLVQGIGGMAYGDPNDDIIITTLAEMWWVGPNMAVVMSHLRCDCGCFHDLPKKALRLHGAQGSQNPVVNHGQSWSIMVKHHYN